MPASLIALGSTYGWRKKLLVVAAETTVEDKVFALPAEPATHLLGRPVLHTFRSIGTSTEPDRSDETWHIDYPFPEMVSLGSKSARENGPGGLSMGEVKMQKTAAALKALSGRYGVTINELASHLDVSRRSAYRMLESLEGLGVKIETTMDNDGVFRKKIDEAERKRWESGIPPLELTVEEIIGLYLLKGGETVFKGTEVEGAIHSAFEKIEALLPADRARRKGVSLAPLRSLFLSSSRFTKDYSGKDELIALLADAIIRRRRCTLRYRAFRDDTEKTYGADPLHFFERDGGLYLYVRKAKEGHIRTLAVERIEEVKPTEESFDYPADFDPEAFMEQAFNLVHDDPVTAHIRFEPDQAKYIREQRWAKTQKINEKRDGSVVLDIETSGFQEVKRWVLSFGATAVVISPRELRDDVEAELAKGLDRYRKGPRG